MLNIKKVPPKANKKFMLQKYYNIVAKICQQDLHKKLTKHLKQNIFIKN